MPRARKPGPVGNAGNRTDRPLPVVTGPSKQYGEAAAQQRAQKQLPMASGDVGAGGAGPAPADAGQGGGAPPIAPGDLTPPDAPSDRPNEPLTHGLPTGPGAGPEALAAPDPRINVAAILNQLGEQNIDPATRRLRSVLNAQINNTHAQ